MSSSAWTAISVDAVASGTPWMSVSTPAFTSVSLVMTTTATESPKMVASITSIITTISTMTSVSFELFRFDC